MSPYGKIALAFIAIPAVALALAMDARKSLIAAFIFAVALALVG